MKAIALIIFLFIELLFIVGTALVLYHFYGFRAGRSHKPLIAFFIAGSVFLFFVEFMFFISMDWEIILTFVKNSIFP